MAKYLGLIANIRSLWRRPRLRIALIVILAALVVLYGLISFYMARGVTTAERNPQEDHPSNYGLQADDVEFHPRDGDLRLSGWYIQGEGQNGGDAPHLIFVHGLGNVRSGNEAVELADRLADRGYSILMFDLRGHGSSEGGRVSGGYYERWDVLGAYDYLVDQRGAEAGEIGLMGFSMGGSTAILAAVEEPGIRAVAADSPYAAASELVAQEAARRTVLPEWAMPAFMPTTIFMARAIYGIDIGALTPVKAVTQLDYPVLIIHGARDERVSVDHGERVAEASGHSRTEFWRTDAPGHIESFNTYPDEYAGRVDAYFEGLLK